MSCLMPASTPQNASQIKDVHDRTSSAGRSRTASLGIRDKVHRSERALFDHLIGESTRVLAPPLAHGTDDWAEVATLCGEDVLGPRGTHRIEASLDDAILLKRPQTLR